MVHDQPHRSEATDDVHQMFQRVLTTWAMDALALRRRGLDRPSSREGAGLALVRPERPEDSHMIYAPAEPAITWRTGHGKAA